MKKAERMFNLVALWRESSLSKEEFCQQHDLKSGTFDYWISKVKKVDSEDTGGFTRLESLSIESGYEITYPNGVKLHVKNASLSTLSQLLKL